MHVCWLAFYMNAWKTIGKNCKNMQKIHNDRFLLQIQKKFYNTWKQLSNYFSFAWLLKLVHALNISDSSKIWHSTLCFCFQTEYKIIFVDKCQYRNLYLKKSFIFFNPNTINLVHSKYEPHPNTNYQDFLFQN